MTTTDVDVTGVARRLAHYAKTHHAGAFGTPLAKELRPGGGYTIHTWEGTVGVSRHLTRDSARRDFTGRRFTLPAGSHVLTHLARDPGAPIPTDLGAFDFVMAYTEDHDLTHGLERLGFTTRGIRISASSEVIGCYGPPPGHLYPARDITTAIRIPAPDVPLIPLAAEAARLDGWYDDYPFYSDGSWSALSLRGFYADPRLGVKPSEMPRTWRETHPRDLTNPIRWTDLDMPATRAWAESIPWLNTLERVRLLRMTRGRLSRHTDITDRAAGTRLGQVVRFHLPLITHPDITMTTWSLDGHPTHHHLPPGELWYLDARKPHAVDNPTDTTRIHLVLDAIVDTDVQHTLATAASGGWTP